MVRISILALFAALSTAAPAVVSTFDAGNEGWRTCDVNFVQAPLFSVGDFASAGWSGAGGNPGGALVTADVSSWCFLAAPTKFMGDQSAAFGSSLSYDTYATQNDGAPYPAVVLTSGTTALFASKNPPGTVWTSVSIPLLGSVWSLSPGIAGTPPVTPVSDALLRSVLSSLDGLYIEADWLGNAPTDVTGLDNVRLAPVPEPASVSVLALGALSFFCRSRRLATASRRRAV